MTLVQSHLQYNDWRARQLCNVQGVMWCCVNMKPCPTEDSLYRVRLTGRCSVTACQYEACLGGPFLTLSGPNTFFLLPFKSSFYLIIPEVSKYFFSPNLISLLTFFSFSLSPPPIWFLFFSLPESDSQRSFTSSLFYITHTVVFLQGMFCVFLQNLNLPLHSNFYQACINHKLRVAPFLECLLTATFCG